MPPTLELIRLKSFSLQTLYVHYLYNPIGHFIFILLRRIKYVPVERRCSDRCLLDQAEGILSACFVCPKIVHTSKSGCCIFILIQRIKNIRVERLGSERCLVDRGCRPASVVGHLHCLSHSARAPMLQRRIGIMVCKNFLQTT